MVFAGLAGRLTESSGDVILGFNFVGIEKDFLRVVEFDQFAQHEEAGLVADAGRLLHVVGDDDDRVALLERVDQLLDLGGGDGVERRGGLIHQQDGGRDGQRAGNAQALLLTAGEFIGRFFQLVLDLVPEGGADQRLLDLLADEPLVAYAVDPQAVGHVLEDGFREGVGLLEYHAHILAEFVDIDAAVIDVPAVDQAFAGQPRGGDQVVHAVEQAQERRLAAARGADERRYGVGLHAHGDVLERMEVAVIEIDVLCFYHGSALVRFDFFAEVASQQRGQQVHGQHDDDQHQGRAVGDRAGGFEVGAARGDHVEVVGQCHHLVVDARGQFGQEVGGGREEDRRRFARHAADGEDQSRRDVREGRREHHFPDGLEFGGTQRQTARAVGVGHGLQGLFRRADDQRQGQQTQRERTGDDRIPESECIDEEGHAEQTEDDRRDAAQVVGHDADEADDLAVAGIFGRVDGRHDAQRKGDDHAAHNQAAGADDGGEDAAARHAVGRSRREEFPVDDPDAVVDDEAEDPQQDGYDQQTQQAERPERDALIGSFVCHKPLLDCRLEIISAVMLMIIVMTKRMQPSRKSAW